MKNYIKTTYKSNIKNIWKKQYKQTITTILKPFEKPYKKATYKQK